MSLIPAIRSYTQRHWDVTFHHKAFTGMLYFITRHSLHDISFAVTFQNNLQVKQRVCNVKALSVLK